MSTPRKTGGAPSSSLRLKMNKRGAGDPWKFEEHRGRDYLRTWRSKERGQKLDPQDSLAMEGIN